VFLRVGDDEAPGSDEYRFYNDKDSVIAKKPEARLLTETEIEWNLFPQAENKILLATRMGLVEKYRYLYFDYDKLGVRLTEQLFPAQERWRQEFYLKEN
jgi:hypothetical protein